jgi:hypothetical protein
VSVHGLACGIEAIMKSKLTSIFYDFLEGIDALTLITFVLKSPVGSNDDVRDYFRNNDPEPSMMITFKQA